MDNCFGVSALCSGQNHESIVILIGVSEVVNKKSANSPLRNRSTSDRKDPFLTIDHFKVFRVGRGEKGLSSGGQCKKRPLAVFVQFRKDIIKQENG
jgi:hypothetical protein